MGVNVNAEFQGKACQLVFKIKVSGVGNYWRGKIETGEWADTDFVFHVSFCSNPKDSINGIEIPINGEKEADQVFILNEKNFIYK